MLALALDPSSLEQQIPVLSALLTSLWLPAREKWGPRLRAPGAGGQAASHPSWRLC